PYGWDNDIAVLDMGAARARRQAPLATLYRPPTPRLVCDIDLHFGGGRLLFSMPGSSTLWQVFEMDADGRRARQLSPVEPRDVQSFDACYLPDDSIAFASTAPFQGVPCSDGIAVAVIYRMQADGAGIRQLCFDQDHDYCPTVTNDGRILYMRWDYTDLPHQWPRILFTMNPDGTGQREFYGSNSYWPNAIFYARPVPDHPTRVVGIVTGHHVGRVGELVVFDPALGRHEADGVVQRIPGRGKTVEPIIKDKLAIDSWPKFVHPHPLSSKYFLVSCKPGPDSLWGVYLVDVFDNMVLLREEEGRGLFEPIPFRATPRPPVITDRVDLARQDALMYVEDVYQGPGLRGVPRGTVKTLRLFTYAFAYPYKSGGQHRVGSDGPWEPKRVLGTVPVESDGSALFRVPANTPISMQPLDGRGRAVQLMRSWTTAMPGEIVSCTGCHESQSTAPSGRKTLATLRPPSEIQPWHGPARGFSFPREVQPVLDAHCVRCHDGKAEPDLRAEQGFYVVFDNRDPRPKRVSGVAREELVRRYAGVFPPAYVALRRHVRVGGLESDLHLLNPREFGANTAELVQMLEKGHYGVRLDAEAWERLAAWIDLNAPCHGTWGDVFPVPDGADKRRAELRKLYGGPAEDPEAIPDAPRYEPRPRGEVSSIANRQSPIANPPGWPFSAADAKRRQSALGAREKTLDLGNGVTLTLARIPAGAFVMGDASGEPDEQPLARVTVAEPFWLGKCEVTNEQFRRFAPSHQPRYYTRLHARSDDQGLPLDGPRQPVVRVSWHQAMAFCEWLSRRTGLAVALPTEAQWEWACRAGTSHALAYGDVAADFSRHANVADRAYANVRNVTGGLQHLIVHGQALCDSRFDDRHRVTAPVGSYAPNAWGLHDLHGNAAEWTLSAYRPYPYVDGDGRNKAPRELAGSSPITRDASRVTAPASRVTRRVVRGGSFFDRPARCRSAFRLAYPPWQRVFNVGFRVACVPRRRASAP
ncbi:SUMF1/EgtB/PvdO family nonheme iron enzyme, partial [bacterium]|nr:SUMF1/EgtB/PvdO family nonheme iron enzyme [bacterium]